MSSQNVSKEQSESKTSKNTPREWKFGLFDCFSDLGLCNYFHSFTFKRFFSLSFLKKKLI
jgi:hypothetical protein